jgi:hypothetical protein
MKVHSNKLLVFTKAIAFLFVFTFISIEQTEAQTVEWTTCHFTAQGPGGANDRAYFIVGPFPSKFPIANIGYAFEQEYGINQVIAGYTLAKNVYQGCSQYDTREEAQNRVDDTPLYETKVSYIYSVEWQPPSQLTGVETSTKPIVKLMKVNNGAPIPVHHERDIAWVQLKLKQTEEEERVKRIATRAESDDGEIKRLLEIECQKRKLAATSQPQYNFGIIEMFSNRDLYSTGNERIRFERLNAGKTLLFRDNHRTFELSVTPQQGVFSAREISRKSFVRNVRAQLQTDGSLDIYYTHEFGSNEHIINIRVIGTRVEVLKKIQAASDEAGTKNAFYEKDEYDRLASGVINARNQRLGKTITLGETISDNRKGTSVFRFVGLVSTTFTASITTKREIIITLYGLDGKKIATVEGENSVSLKSSLSADAVYFLSVVRSDVSEPLTLSLISQN